MKEPWLPFWSCLLFSRRPARGCFGTETKGHRGITEAESLWVVSINFARKWTQMKLSVRNFTLPCTRKVKEATRFVPCACVVPHNFCVSRVHVWSSTIFATVRPCNLWRTLFPSWKQSTHCNKQQSPVDFSQNLPFPHYTNESEIAQPCQLLKIANQTENVTHTEGISQHSFERYAFEQERQTIILPKCELDQTGPILSSRQAIDSAWAEILAFHLFLLFCYFCKIFIPSYYP